MPTELEEYLFDLQGYLHLENAIDRAHVAELNDLIDTYNDIEAGEWRGWVHLRAALGARPLWLPALTRIDRTADAGTS